MKRSDSRTERSTERDWNAIAWIAMVAVVSSLAGIGNEFAQDDVHLIQYNDRIHDLWNWKEIVTSPFWPAPLSQDLYRPLTALLHSLEFVVGGGGPTLFRVVSYLLYAATAVGVFLVGTRILPRRVAFGASLVFAAHPVHTEAVALAAGQSELIVALIAALMVVRYVDRRRRDGLRTSDWIALIALYVAACLAKEQGFVLPGLLVAAEVCLLTGPLAARMRVLWKGYAGLALSAVLLLLLRRWVLGGDVAGTFTAEALQGLSISGRALTMLTVVPEWTRLLVWPAHLRLDYSPQEMVASTTFGARELFGALQLTIAMGVALVARRRAPAVTFGLLWCAVALLPVSNVLIPTGVLLAERTLFLPSMGFLFAIGGAAAMLIAANDVATSRVWHGLQTVCIVVVLAGVLRSVERQRVWRNEALLAVRSVQDAPDSFRTQRSYGDVLFELHENALALQAYRRAIALSPHGTGWRVRNDLAAHYRELEERLLEAEQLRASLAEQPNQHDVWGYLVAADLALGLYAEAARDADVAIQHGGSISVFQGMRAVADSATRVSAPPGSVKLRIRTTPAGSGR